MNNTLQIGERTYSFGTIPALEAVQVEIAVAQVIGEPLFKAFASAGKSDMSDAEKEAAGTAAIGLLLAKMDAAKLTETMQTVFKYVSIGNQRVVIDRDFTGRNKELWQVFLAALRFNFADFLPESLLASLPAALGMKA